MPVLGSTEKLHNKEMIEKKLKGQVRRSNPTGSHATLREIPVGCIVSQSSRDTERFSWSECERRETGSALERAFVLLIMYKTRPHI